MSNKDQVTLIAILIVYLGLSFVEWSILFTQWHPLTRFALILGIYHVITNNKKEEE